MLTAIANAPRLRLAGLMSHFASAHASAEATDAQLDIYKDFVRTHRELIPKDAFLHIANSSAAFRAARFHAGMIRSGQALHGYVLENAHDPETFEFAEFAQSLIPSVRWTTHIAHISTLQAGWPVGYEGSWTAPRDDTRIALLPVGYADGYPRVLSSAPGNRHQIVVRVKAESPDGSIQWHEAPLVGRISMDQITIDVSNVPESALALGAEVELYSNDRAAPNFLPRVAHIAGTNAHDLLTSFSPRVHRDYIRPDADQRRVVPFRAPVPGTASAGGNVIETAPMRSLGKRTSR